MKTTPRTILYSFIKDPENRLGEYRDRFRGERGFIIANGPSLNEIDLSSLRNEITFGVNRIYQHFGCMGFQPTFYYAEDSSIIRNHAEEIRTSITRSTKIFPYVYHKVFDDSVYVNYNPYASILHARFSTDASRKVYWGGLCTYAVMQIVYYMGFETVYLVGFDHNWLELTKSGRPTHFVEGYFSPTQKYNVQKHMWLVNRSYRLARRVFEKDDREIVNCTRGGQLEVFKRQSFEEVVRG
jgi:hypothetical protein